MTPEEMQSAIDEVIKKLIEHGEALDDARKLAENSLKIAEARNLKDKEAILYATRLVTGNKELSRSFTDVRKTIQETTKLYKDGNSTLDQMNSALEDSRRQIQNTTSSQRRAQLMAEKQELENLVLRANASKQFSESMGKLVGSTGATIANALKTNLQQALASNDGLASGAQLMKSGLDVANSAAQTTASGLSKFGATTAGAGGALGKFGIIASVAGVAIGGLGKTITELGKTGIDFLLTQTQETIAGFKTMSAAGAVYAGGMKEMVDTALDANMSLDQLSKATSAHRESLSKAGIGMGEGSKRLAKAMYAGGEDMRRGLFALGYSMEEQAGVMADTMAIMAGPSGKLKASNEEVAIQAEAYAKNLKLISTLTGEDAKAKQDKIRQENDTLFMQQYMDSMDEEQRAAFNALQLTMNENDRRALTEKLKYGQIISKDLAIAGSASPALEKKWNEQKALADSGLRDVGQATRAGLEAQAKSFKQSHKETMAQTGLSVANSEGAVSASSVLAKNNSYAGKISSEGIEKAVAAAYEADRAAKAKEKNADGTDKKDKDGNSIYADKTGAPALMEAGQDFLIAKQKLAAENLDLFAVALTTTTGLLTAAMTELRKLTTPGDKAGKSRLGELFGSDEMKMLGLTIGGTLAASIAWKGITSAWGAIFSKGGAATAVSRPGGLAPGSMAGWRGGANAISEAESGMGGLASGANKLGNGVGGGITRILSGIAKGIAAFGNPKVLFGIANLALLGGAVMVTGMGFKQFLDVKWDDVGKAVVGITAIATVAGIMGIGPIAAAIGIGALLIAGLGVSIGILGAALKGFPTGMFSGLTDMFSGMGDALGGMFGDAFKSVSESFTNAWGVVKQFASDFIAPFKTAFSWVSDKVSGVGSAISDTFTSATSKVSDAIDWVKETFTANFGSIGEVAASVGAAIGKVFSGSIDWISDKITAMGKTFKDIFVWIGNLAKTTFAIIMDPIKAVFDLFEGAKKIWDKITGNTVAKTPEEKIAEATAIKEEATTKDFAKAIELFSKSVEKFESVIDKLINCR